MTGAAQKHFVVFGNGLAIGGKPGKEPEVTFMHRFSLDAETMALDNLRVLACS